ncbi:MAG: hypothetical protein HRU24_13280 [Gammaproteobacteria bacterium]|nr:hypothetical protein [Gammaproteobacteria bacterium]
MHLYCDCRDCVELNMLENDEFIGESWTQVATAARKRGWRISADRTRCFAPNHQIVRKVNQTKLAGQQ